MIQAAILLSFAECWFYKPTAAGTYAFRGNTSPFNFHGAGGLSDVVLGGYISSGSIFVWYKGPSGSTVQRPGLNTGTAMSDIGEGWHHFAWFIDSSGDSAYYLNGVKIGGEPGLPDPDPTDTPVTGWSNTYSSNAGYCPDSNLACIRFSQGNPYGNTTAQNFTPLSINSAEWQASDKVKLFIPLNAGTKSTVQEIGPGPRLTFDVGTWDIGASVTGPETTAGTGVVGSVNELDRRITLSSIDETGTKRWCTNAGKYAIGPTIAVESGLKIYGSDFLSDPVDTLLHTTTDWQITLKTDLAYSNPVDNTSFDGNNLTTLAAQQP